MKICPICQKKNSSTASFCTSCGAALKNVEPAAQSIVQSNPASSAPIPIETEPPRLLAPDAQTEQTDEAASSEAASSTVAASQQRQKPQAADDEAEESEIETGPLEPPTEPLEGDFVLASLSENQTDEQSAVSNGAAKAEEAKTEHDASRQGEADASRQRDLVAENVNEADSSSAITIAAPSEPQIAVTADSALPTAKLPSLPASSGPATMKLPTPPADETDSAPDTLPPDQAEEGSDGLQEGPANDQNENDDTEPYPTVATPVPLTAKLPPMPPKPLSAGELVAQRYQIIEWLRAEEAVNIYSAQDLHICAVCHFDNQTSSADDQFCAECGIDRTQTEPLECELRESEIYEVSEQKDFQTGLIYNDLFYLPIIKEVESPIESPPEPEVDPTRRTNMTFSVGYASHVGMIRRLNEDSLSIFTLAGVYESVSNPSLGLFIVADGLGGHDGGEVASKFVVQKIADRLIRRILRPKFNEQPLHPDAIMPRVEEAVLHANEQLYNLAGERLNDMGCTLTMALVIGLQVYIANVGDSRTYIYREGQLRQITVDHSLIASLIAAGIAEPHEIYTHPERNVIYRSMGHAVDVEVDVWQEELMVGDQLLLCSDGLWELVHDQDMIKILQAQENPQAACDEMVYRANLAGGEDNITVILAKID